VVARNVYERDDMEGLDRAILMNRLCCDTPATKPPSPILSSIAASARSAFAPTGRAE
jgi:hypothetical protein